MKNIVILGASPAGIKAAEEIRKLSEDARITVVTFDSHYPYDRGRFADFLAKEISLQEILYQSKDFYQKNKIDVLLNQNISRVNLKRNKIFVDNENEKGQIDFDLLIVTDVPEHRFPDIKGTQKEGVFGVHKLRDIQQIFNNIALTEETIVQCNSSYGLKLAVSLARRNKEVTVILPDSEFLVRLQESPLMEWIPAVFEELGVRVMEGKKIAEVLGDAQVKAIRLDSGKVLASDMVIFEDTRPDLRVFADSPLLIQQKICVDQNFKTNLEHVYAVDLVCERLDNLFEMSSHQDLVLSQILDAQGMVVASEISSLINCPV